jgi:DNA-directed RNA polymerase specialized sigma24 family protein/ribosome-associated translation inhibitor RaiA
MNLHFSFKSEKSTDLEKDIHQHARKFERYLHVFRPDLVHLHGTLAQGPKESFRVSLNLRLPTGQLFASDEGGTAQLAAKVAFSDLLHQLKRHKELLRREHRWRRHKKEARGIIRDFEETVEQVLNPAASPARRTNGETAAPELTAATFQENGSLLQADVREYLNANLEKLGRFVGRELRYRENLGQMVPGQVSAEEVIDEVVVTALSAEERPAHITLERWLYKLSLQALKQLARSAAGDPAALHLEQTVRPQNVSGSDEVLMQYHQPGETLRQEDLIPDPAMNSPEELAANDELMEQMELALLGLAPEARQTFILRALEGLTVEEIAHVTDRAAEEVIGHLQVAREHLDRRLSAANTLKESLLRHAQVAGLRREARP